MREANLVEPKALFTELIFEIRLTTPDSVYVNAQPRARNRCSQKKFLFKGCPDGLLRKTRAGKAKE